MKRHGTALSLSLLVHAALIAAMLLSRGAWRPPQRIELLDLALLPPVQKVPASPAPASRSVSPVSEEPVPNQPAVSTPPPPPKPALSAPEPVPDEIVAKAPPPPPEPDETAVAVPAPAPVEPVLPPTESPTPMQRSREETPPMVSKEAVAATEAPATVTAESSARPAAAKLVTPEQAREFYLAEHFAYIRDRVLACLSYPSIARRFGWSGETRVAFQILADGQIKALRVDQSSGHKVLDRQALQAVQQAAPFPSPPVIAELVLPVTFHLR